MFVLITDAPHRRYIIKVYFGKVVFKMAKKNYYAVRQGVKPGIYNTWAECQAQVKGFSGAAFKSFSTQVEAEHYLYTKTTGVVPSSAIGVDCEVTAYVDGSYEDTVGKYAYGAVVFHKGEEFCFADSGNNTNMLAMRNVAGEITGAMAAMQYCLNNGVTSLKLCYDYEGIEKWCTGEWNAGKPGTQAYKAFYDQIKGGLSVTFVKIAAHTGNITMTGISAKRKSAVR
jgi:ribonuclease HI